MKSYPTEKILKICDFERGTEPGSKSYNRKSIGVPFIRVGNIAAQIQEQIYTNSKNVKLCEQDDILIALDGSPGVVVRGIKGAYSSGIRKIVLKDPQKLNYDFIFYLLQTDRIQNTIKEHSTGMTIKHAAKSLEHIQIPFPPLLTQQKIVKILDAVNSAVGVQERIIEKTKELKKAMMKKLFTEGVRGEKLKKTEIGKIPESWEVVRLKELSELITKGTTPTTYGFSYITTGINFIKIESIDGDGNFIPEKFAHINEKANKYISRSILKEGDFLFSIAGALGRVAIADRSILPANTNQALAIVRLKSNKKIDIKFLKAYLMSFLIQNYIKNILIKSAQSNLTLEHVKNFFICIPPLPEQREIAEMFQTVDQKIEIEQKKKALYEELFKSLLNKIMKQEVDVGKIRV